MSQAVQAIIVSKTIAETLGEARKIARSHGSSNKTSRETETSFRFRQRPPSDFKEGSFKTYSIANGVSLVKGETK